MSTEPTQDSGAPEGVGFEQFETANDRFKQSFGSWFWGSMLAAVVVHFAVMAFWPNLQASDMDYTMEDFEAVDLPPEIEIPPPPEQIQRPANPVVSEAVIDDDITIAPTSFEENQPDDLPPPPTGSEQGIGDQPVFTPREVEPEMINRDEVSEVLQREYPTTLQDAGIGGVVELYLFIDENGRVQNREVSQSSGREALDAAAIRVTEAMRFSPAINQDQPVPVWIVMPINFTAR